MTIQHPKEERKPSVAAQALLVGPENCEAVTGRTWRFCLDLVRTHPAVRRITSGRRIVAIVADDLVQELAHATSDVSQVSLAEFPDEDDSDTSAGMPTNVDAILARLGHRRAGA